MANKTKIKFFDIKKINKSYEDSFRSVFNDFLKSEQIILGPKTQEFEDSFAKYCGTRHCLGISNGLDALKIILKSYLELGVFNEGDEVIVPANTFIASILAISESGLKPVLVDADIQTYNIDFRKIEEKITKKTKAIMIVHLYGQVAFSNLLSLLAKKYDLKIIEDSAQGHGAYYKNKRAGSLGHASGFSFYPTKNLGALGEAGAITTDDEDLFDMAKHLRNYGSKVRYYNEYKGYNCRIDELQAALLIEKLRFLDLDNAKRVENAKYLSSGIKNDKLILPDTNYDKSHVNHLYVVRTSKRDEFESYLKNNGIQTIVHYPIPPHLQKAYHEISNQEYPISEEIHNTIISLPSNIHLEKNELDYVIKVCNDY